SDYLVPAMETKVWAEPAGWYEPSHLLVFLDADLVPESAKSLLIGKERTYDPNLGWSPAFTPPRPLREGYEVTAAEAFALRAILDDEEWDHFAAIYPHGQPAIG